MSCTRKPTLLTPKVPILGCKFRQIYTLTLLLDVPVQHTYLTSQWHYRGLLPFISSVSVVNSNHDADYLTLWRPTDSGPHRRDRGFTAREGKWGRRKYMSGPVNLGPYPPSATHAPPSTAPPSTAHAQVNHCESWEVKRSRGLFKNLCKTVLYWHWVRLKGPVWMPS